MSAHGVDLSVNLNKIALIRNSRDTDYPSVTEHAQMCIDAGADGITVHPRPDQRHIRASDCAELAAMLTVEFNIEGNPFAGPKMSDRKGVSDYPGFMQIVRDNQPAQCTLVPDSEAQLTSDHGFDLTGDTGKLREIIAELRELNIRVSLFMDPDLKQIDLAREIGADRIELYTGPYAEAWGTSSGDSELEKFANASRHAAELGLGVNAGHDLNLDNLTPLAQRLPALREVSIGHAFTVDCIRMGLASAVAAYQRCLGKKTQLSLVEK